MLDRVAVIEAIRQSWSTATSTEGDFTVENPAKGQCVVSSFVAWRFLGGDLVPSQVFLSGKEVEHRCWNRVDGEDLDSTRELFRHGEGIVEVNVLPDAFLAEKMNTMKPIVLSRISILSDKVAATLGEEAPLPAPQPIRAALLKAWFPPPFGGVNASETPWWASSLDEEARAHD